MCFSASASFVAGTALSAVGVITLRGAVRGSDIPLASVPLLFGVQQIVEGLVWLSFRDGSALPSDALTFVYSVFSHVLWPILVPFAVRQIEPVRWRRTALAACQLAGIAVGLYLLYIITIYPVTSRVLGQHIVYESPHFFAQAVMTLYLAATCLSSLLSSARVVRALGLLTFAAFTAAYVIHAATLVSVWCFFAAILSVLVYVYIQQQRAAVDPPLNAPAWLPPGSP
ncbi:MAG: DUF6629 family protein [Reyranella sp.]